MDTTYFPQFTRRPARSLAAAMFAGALALTSCIGGPNVSAPGDATTEVTATTTAATASPTTVTESPPVEHPPPETDDGTGDDTGNGTADATTSPVEHNPPTAEPPSPLGELDTMMKENMEFTGGDLTVSDIRLASHDGFDRVVFDVAGEGVPGWSVAYTDYPGKQGSGFPIDYEGVSALSVNLHGMTRPIEVGGVDGVGGVVTEVIPDISHHGTAQFIIGVAERAAFSVTLLEEPTRVVVDVLHEPAAELTPLGVPNLRADARDPAPPYQREVTGVRMATHEGFDRVVFETAGSGVAGWRAEYMEEPLNLHSREPVQYDGETAISINLTGVTGAPGGAAVSGAGGVVTEVADPIIYDGEVQFVIGLNGSYPYSVTLLKDPQRVVVDILHEPAAPAVAPLGDPSTLGKHRESEAPQQRQVSDVRMARHDGFDRVVFDTVGEGKVGWSTYFTEAPVEQASGLPIHYDGSVALEVNLTGVIDEAESGYSYLDLGPMPGVGGAVNEVIAAVNWHGTSQFIVGLDAETPYSIQLLEDPQRVVIDILHH